MERRRFIKKCGMLGASCFGIAMVLDSCVGTHRVITTLENNKVKLPKLEFIESQGSETKYRKSLVLNVKSLNYPIVVFRFSETEYKALLLRCTHQGVELNLSGDLISCSAHGSEFNNKGEVVLGPAEQNLKTFPVSMDQHNIYLSIPD